MTAPRLTAGSPDRLGATPDADGVGFAVFSRHATKIEVCLFDDHGEREVQRIALPERSSDVFHGHVADLRVGARYGLRAHGPYAPQDGHRFNAGKLLMDPYARVVDRAFALHPSMFAYRRDDPAADLSFDETDSAPHMPKAIVTAPLGPDDARRPHLPWSELAVYEMHVKGFSQRHEGIPSEHRGTFAALAQPAALAHLRELGVTAVEFMPCAAWLDERHLPPLGLRNYWGYNSAAFMAPDPKLAPGGWAEVRAAVDALHAIGIEAIVDIVLNHSCESDELGPTVSLRGLDNATYYRLIAGDPRRYINDMACGNCVALAAPPVVALALETMRTWAILGGIDGFRFDLAPALGRRESGFDPAAPLLEAIHGDPLLGRLKLIAEPWDVGPGGYQVGRFPHTWGEWNDHFRDDVRRFWRGDGGMLGPLATRLAGSADLFAAKVGPSRSVNFVVAHDGFTLADLVSFAHKHNEANGEGNRDGTTENYSWNHGFEGATEDASVLAARARDQRNFLATLILARGTPMLAMGSEFGHSQRGNNNAYSQDNDISWLDWRRADPGLLAYARRLLAIRRAHPALRQDRFLDGKPSDESGFPDVDWRNADGTPLSVGDWNDGAPRVLVVVLCAREPAGDIDRVALAFQRGDAAAALVLPAPRHGLGWHRALDTASDAPGADVETPPLLAGRSLAVFVERAAAVDRGEREGSTV